MLIQSKYNSIANPVVSSVSCSFDSPISLGNTIFVVEGYYNEGFSPVILTTLSVSDTFVNSFSSLAPSASRVDTNQIEYLSFYSASSSTSGLDTITVSFSGVPTNTLSLIFVTILEYSGLFNLDVSSFSTGIFTSGGTFSNSFTTTNSSDLVVVGWNSINGGYSPGPGLTAISNRCSVGTSGPAGLNSVSYSVPTFSGTQYGYVIQQASLYGYTSFPQSVSTDGILSSESFSTISASVTGTASRSTPGINSSQSFGLITVSAPAITSLAGIPSGASFGSVSVSAPATVTSNGIPSSESFSTFTITSLFLPIQAVQTNSHFNAIGPTGNCTFLSPITLGDFIVVVMMVGGAITITSCTDSVGNIYKSAVTNSDSIIGGTTAIYYAPITVGGGTTPTITAAYSVSHSSGLFVYEFSGINLTSPIDSLGVGSPHGSSGTNISSTPMAMTSNPNDLIIGGAFAFPAGPITAAEVGWTAQTLASSAFLSEYIIVSTQGIYAATCTQSGSSYIAVVASFQSTAIGPATTMSRIY